MLDITMYLDILVRVTSKSTSIICHHMKKLLRIKIKKLMEGPNRNPWTKYKPAIQAIHKLIGPIDRKKKPMMNKVKTYNNRNNHIPFKHLPISQI